jgi:hypothetical protein
MEILSAALDLAALERIRRLNQESAGRRCVSISRGQIEWLRDALGLRLLCRKKGAQRHRICFPIRRLNKLRGQLRVKPICLCK